MSKKNSKNKSSINQVVKAEYKFIIFISALLLLPWIITQIVLIFDLVKFNNLGLMGQFQVLLGMGDFSFSNLMIVGGIMAIVRFGLLPLFANTTARRINGQGKKEAINAGLDDYKQKRTWNYMLKVVVPFILIMGLISFLLKLIPANTWITVLSSIMSSALLMVVVTILIIAIVVILLTLVSLVMVGYTIYMRGELGIKQSLNTVSKSQVNLLLGFNVIDVLGKFFILIMFSIPLLSMSVEQLFVDAIPIIIMATVVLVIYEILIYFYRITVYMSAASNIEISEMIENTYYQEVREVAEINPFEKTTINGPVLSIQPKQAKHKNRIDTSTKKIKPKR